MLYLIRKGDSAGEVQIRGVEHDIPVQDVGIEEAFRYVRGNAVTFPRFTIDSDSRTALMVLQGMRNVGII